MILTGIGANLPHPALGEPRRTCGAALTLLQDAGLRIARRSRWYRTAPVIAAESPACGSQPWYVNAVVAVETDRSPSDVLEVLLATERRLGRERSVRDAARTIDLDLIAYDDVVMDEPGRDGRPDLVLPHPRLHERLFVLRPIADIDPAWRHPVTGRTTAEMIAALGGGDQGLEPVPDAEGAFGTEWPPGAPLPGG